jgi:hypothetical protein
MVNEKPAADAFTANPYPANTPKYLEYEERRKREQRAVVQSRFKHSFKLRVADYNRVSGSPANAVPASRRSPSQAAHEPRAAAAKPSPPTVTARFTNVPTGVEGAKPTCAVTLHGGSTIWVGHDNGIIAVLKGTDGTVAATFSVNRAVSKDTPFRRDVMKQLNGKADDKKADTSKDPQSAEKKGPGVTAMTAVSPSTIAVGLSDGQIACGAP